MVARALATSPFANQNGAISPSSTPVSGCSTSRAAGPCERDQRVPAARIDRRDVADALDLLADPGEVLRGIRRIDDDQEMDRRHAVDDHVVEEGAVRRQQSRVLGLPDLQLRRVAARDPLHRGFGVLAGDFDLAHVADVEDARPGAHRHVLAGDAGVLDRHFPAGKGHHARLRCAVAGVERGFPQDVRMRSRRSMSFGDVRGGHEALTYYPQSSRVKNGRAAAASRAAPLRPETSAARSGPPASPPRRAARPAARRRR